MLKHIEIMVVNKYTGEIKHDLKRTCLVDNQVDFIDWFHRVSDGFIRLIQKSSDNVITISCDDYKFPQQQYLDL